MTKDTEKQGELFILSGAFLWGLFPIITLLSYATLSPLVSLTGSALFAAVFFSIIITIQRRWGEFAQKNSYKDLFMATLITAIIFYLLTFFGLQHTTPGNVSIIALTEVFFSYLFFHVWQKDNIPKEHVAGALLMVLGAIFVLYPNVHTPRIGDLLILLAAAIAPFGNYFQRRARKSVSSQTIMLFRSVISGLFVLFLAMMVKAPFSTVDMQTSLIFLAINGTFMLGVSKIFWIEGIHRISVVKANALSALAPLITLLTAWAVLRIPPTLWQVLAFIPMFIGILLLGVKNKQEVLAPQENN
ncbi:hypothetical protein A3A64_00730 [Candidatus Gottesmanbacteria bacterium RIFCSPLOWO2_01_FULL_48_11]|uniref:EamA domain-containing protein n=2 Tax=Candidatus Gottesmaniibacteriota TaxID=1752720 RepID=A0A0G1U0Q7_9BACT|nr:MAG: hypothetical protein UY16_C0022G0014 [Candidatus Gottesmanbacteria bacterium GW2011_GWA2_47_9]OGG28248.1 MAG: hypothetical protein A3A64_00730 [Candidatus Gottesmanbacteria bacterium RIFCSPLOWO2_01_FULL_48_11]